MIMSRCSDCGENKPPADFYVSNAASCKECVKRRVRANRAENLERIRAYDRSRSDLPHRVAIRQRAAEQRRQDPAKKSIDLRTKQRWADRNFVKRRAHIMVDNAIKYGNIIRPNQCSRCSIVCVPDGHHEDYYKPLEVTWLCEDCHGKRHREINEERRQLAITKEHENA